LTAGTSASADRLSAYRIGGFLPLASEFPLIIPGYYYQELSCTRFALLNARYSVPIDPDKRFSLTAVASAAVMTYLPGESQGGSSIGRRRRHRLPVKVRHVADAAGLRVRINAVRDHGRGAETVGLLMQLDLEPALSKYFNPSDNEGILRGLSTFMRGVF